MSCNVFANSNGLFHKGSSGSGAAFPDVCLTPPPPPAGPLPIPYPNKISAGDIADGSSTVKIQGNPTALKDQTTVSTSTGNEAATQGGGVITHKTKGKAVATFWSFDVKIEGLNVVRHGDPAGQNTATPPFNGLDTRLTVVSNAVKDAKDPDEKCEEKFGKSKRNGSPTDKQRAHVNKASPAICWECKKPSPHPMVADHQPPCLVKYYAGGCHESGDPNPYKTWCKSNEAVKPHCRSCSSSQGGYMSQMSRTLRSAHGF